jgi:hypothetical protein
MLTKSRQPSFSLATPLKPIAGIATAALLIGWAAGVGAQSTNQPALPPLPPAKPGDTTQNNAPPSAQAPAASQPQAALPASNANLPSLPLGHDDVREVQNQLIALGFDPGPADGEAGPATIAAAQQYDQSRGGGGRVSIDSALLARLKADTAPRLTYDQVAARSQARSPAQSQAQAPASAANQIGSVVQQLAPLIGAVVNSSSYGNYGGGYGYGGYPGPGYYGPAPIYGYPYGGY